MSSPSEAPPAPIHRLALVVGSGGVRSVAAVGVAEVLARRGIRPDLLVGCSSGALVGAALALGLSPDEALRRLQAHWKPELTEQRRWRAWGQLLLPRLLGFGADFALRDGRPMAAGFEAGFGEQRLEALPTPLRVAVTDAATGQPALLTRGRLVDALRATMAVPFLFPSVEVEGRRLQDGFVSDPLPVGAARDAGAVLALGFHGAMPRRIDRPSRMLAQVTTAMTNNLLEARVEAARAAGQRVLRLELVLDRRVGIWETAALPYLREAGRRAAEARLAEIEVLWAETAGQRPLPAPDRARGERGSRVEGRSA